MVAALAATAVATDSAEAACSLELVFTPCIEMSVPSSYAWGSLGPGTATSAEQAVTVSSNDRWGMRVSSDRSDGRLTQWTGSSYPTSPVKLTHPMQWALTKLNGAATTPTWTSMSASAVTVVSGRPATGCTLGLLCGSSTAGLTYRQTVSYADRRLAPQSYRMSVTYTATHGW